MDHFNSYTVHTTSKYRLRVMQSKQSEYYSNITNSFCSEIIFRAKTIHDIAVWLSFSFRKIWTGAPELTPDLPPDLPPNRLILFRINCSDEADQILPNIIFYFMSLRKGQWPKKDRCETVVTWELSSTMYLFKGCCCCCYILYKYSTETLTWK